MDYLGTECVSLNTRNDSILELRISEFNQNFEEQKFDEHEINIEDLIDQMEANNFNRETALYSGSPISIYEACVSTHCVKCGAILIKSNEKTCSPNCIYNDQHRSYGKIAELAIMNVEYEVQREAECYADLINDYSVYVKQLVPCDIINGWTVNLCLQVNSMYNMNIESCLRKMLSQIDDEYKMHLRSLCFCVSTVEDETIKILKAMTSDEELLINHRIKRERDKIYLQWK
ncbi:unnamed protein product [Rotaria sordida]|uniref:Uncharacterized protein n=1 Tax=Rotaria sordida TaxID=392033 RepID=A0A819FGP8_9BILA|nr:unnamed protein product [Rotaria sordida]